MLSIKQKYDKILPKYIARFNVEKLQVGYTDGALMALLNGLRDRKFLRSLGKEAKSYVARA